MTRDRAHCPARALFQQQGATSFGHRRIPQHFRRIPETWFSCRKAYTPNPQHWTHQPCGTPYQDYGLLFHLVRVSSSRSSSQARFSFPSFRATLLLGSTMLRFWDSFRTLWKFRQEMARSAASNADQRWPSSSLSPSSVPLWPSSRQLSARTQRHLLHFRFHVPDSIAPMPVQCSQGIAQARLECATNLFTRQAPTPFAYSSCWAYPSRIILQFRAGLAEHTRLDSTTRISLYSPRRI